MRIERRVKTWTCWSVLALMCASVACNKEKAASSAGPASAPRVAEKPHEREASGAMVVAVRSQGAESQGSVKVCVHLESNPGNVSGMQMDLTWDPACLQVEEAGGEPQCTMNPEAQRGMFRAAKREQSMRVLFLNLTDTTPMPASVSELFCCQFRLVDPSRSCEVGLSNVIASDPAGTRLPLTAQGASVSAKGSAS